MNEKKIVGYLLTFNNRSKKDNSTFMNYIVCRDIVDELCSNKNDRLYNIHLVNVLPIYDEIEYDYMYNNFNAI